MDCHAFVTTCKKEVNLIILAIPVVLAYILLSTIAVLAATDTFDVNVNISSFAQITVLPINFTWTGLNPGSDGTTYNFSVTNTGSMNLTNVYISSDALSDEAENPLGSGSAQYYAAAGLILVENETGGGQFYHVGRQEWNISDILADEVLDLAEATSNFAHGFYRNATTGDFLWKLENGSANYCNNTGTVFKILRQPENTTQTYRDFSTGTVDSATFGTQGTNWATHTLAVGALNGYCVATYKDCDRIYIYKYDKSGTFPACSNSSYLSSQTLVIGEKMEFKLYPSIPRGMPAGDTITGTITITAS